MGKKSRVEFLYETMFKPTYLKAIKRNQLSKANPLYPFLVYNSSDDYYQDNLLIVFLINTGLINKLSGVTPRELVFNWLVDCDPTSNKENLTWLIGLYKKQLISIGQHLSEIDNTKQSWEGFPSEIRNFYEDLTTTVKSSLETLSFLKKTNVLSLDKRDINKYLTYDILNKTVLPYMFMGDEEDVDVHTLTHKEIKCIQNGENFKSKDSSYDPDYGRATLLFENDDWVIVRTDDQISNSEFGKYTTWCTAGNRHANMFSNYAGRGDLFVLIKKGFGSKKDIQKNPSNRLQFHFEDQQYMDANDDSISISDFFFKEKGIKDYFRTYITKIALPKRNDKKTHNTASDIKFLLNLGYGDCVIDILKESKPKIIDFSGSKIESKLLNDLGSIDSLEKLDLSDCGLDSLPDTIKNLKNLTYLKLRNNPIKVVPEWVKELKKLNFIDLSSCELSGGIDLDGLGELKDLILDYNKGLTELPSFNTLENLSRFTASNCNIESINQDILTCGNLYLIDVHSNIKLTKVPDNLSSMENIVAICIDDTSIDKDLIKKLNQNKRSNDVVIIKYGD